MSRKIKVIQQEDQPIEQGVLAAHIVEISRHMNRLLSSGLNRKAVIALIHDQSKISKSTIEIILNNLEYLSDTYCK